MFCKLLHLLLNLFFAYEFSFCKKSFKKLVVSSFLTFQQKAFNLHPEHIFLFMHSTVSFNLLIFSDFSLLAETIFTLLPMLKKESARVLSLKLMYFCKFIKSKFSLFFKSFKFINLFPT